MSNIKQKKIQAFDSSHFCGKSCFDDEDNGTQIHLLFQPFINVFNITNSDDISEWKLKWLSDDSIKAPVVSHNCLASALNYSRLDQE